MSFSAELQARGLLHQTTESAEASTLAHIDTPGQVVYAGFDPTADSLHVGHLIPLLLLRRFQQAGHKAIALAGGATGMVGDPSGKSEERNLLDEETLRANVAAIEGQLRRLLDFEGGQAELVDNLDWTKGVTYLEFLRDVGKHFTINTMLRKDSVKNRIEREGAGISYTEFSYMLLQAYDFLVLHRDKGCTIQAGGSDQWGNITAGTELIRRVTGQHAHGLTVPLLTNSDGKKFGKTAAGAVWLDPARTSPFAFRQFWFKTSDTDVIDRLKFFSFLPLEEIAELEQIVTDKSEPNRAQRVLARHMTELVHGRDEADKVETAVEVLFKGDLRQLPAEYLEDALDGAEVRELERGRLEGDGLPLVDVVVDTVYGGGQKRGQARRDIEKDRSVRLNGEQLTDAQRAVTLADALHDTFLVLRKGKKNYFLVKLI